eukprot:SAG31_NODE_2143_length_6342_cov_5.402531_3_plen_225_part_00
MTTRAVSRRRWGGAEGQPSHAAAVKTALDYWAVARKAFEEKLRQESTSGLIGELGKSHASLGTPQSVASMRAWFDALDEESLDQLHDVQAEEDVEDLFKDLLGQCMPTSAPAQKAAQTPGHALHRRSRVITGFSIAHPPRKQSVMMARRMTEHAGRKSLALRYPRRVTRVDQLPQVRSLLAAISIIQMSKHMICDCWHSTCSSWNVRSQRPSQERKTSADFAPC